MGYQVNPNYLCRSPCKEQNDGPVAQSTQPASLIPHKMLRSVIISTLLVFTAAISPFFWRDPQNVLQLHSLNIYSTDVAFDKLTDYVVDSKYSLLKLHRSLVDIESISGNEHDVAQYLAKYLKYAGLTVELQPVAENRHNVYAYFGKQRHTSVVVTSHIDTVPPFIPYSVDGSKIRGRGTCDAKGSVVTQIIAFLDLLNRGELKEGEVSLLFVVGEENTGIGMKTASLDLGVNWDYAIFGEPTENKLGVGHKGIMLFDVEVFGKAAHSGYPHLGVSATEILIPILSRLQNARFPQSELLGPTTVNVGKIDAGVAANVVPAHAKATIAIRVADDFDEVTRIVHAIIDDVDHVAPLKYLGSEPQYLDYKVNGFESIILAYTTDVPNLSLPLKRRYLYGPGTIHVAHGDDEHVENQDLIDAVDGYKRLIKHVLSEKE